MTSGVRVYDERGTPVFSSFANVNSQLNSAAKPELTWTGSGTTQTVTETVDLPEIEGEAESRTLRFEVSSTNIGDGILPTTVEGTLSPGEGEAELKLEWVSAFRSNTTSVPGTVVSIPDSGQNNVFMAMLS